MPATTEFIAHRGSSFLAPENTLASLQLGWKETTTCELDVRPTREGRLLVIHDATTKRTTGVTGRVAQRSLRELQKLDAGSCHGAEWQGEKMPSLEEAIAAMPAGKRLLIEVKSGPKVVPELKRIIRASGKEKRVAIHSFIYTTCVAAKKALPDLPVYLLIASQKSAVTGKWTPTIEAALAKVRQAGLDGMGANCTPLLTTAALKKIHSAGLRLNVWTVDDPREAKKLIALGVDGLITNRPGWIKRRLRLRREG